MTEGDLKLQPLVLLHSVEYPGWPPVDFFRVAERAGFRPIVVRRPGFGANPPLADVDRQAALIGSLFEHLDLSDAVVVSNGSANPIGHRLALSGHERIRFSVFANCAFNYDPLVELQPDWFARTIQQALSGMTGAHLSLMALKNSWGIFGRTWVHESMMRKSAGDIDFLRRNPELVAEAIDTLVQRLDAATFLMEIGTFIRNDPLLSDGCFEGCRALTVTGLETNETWRRGVSLEARRVGLDLVHLSSGDNLALYQSAGELCELLRSAC